MNYLLQKVFILKNNFNGFLNKNNLKKIKIYYALTIVSALLFYVLNENLFFASYTVDISGIEDSFSSLFNGLYAVFLVASSIIAATLIGYNIFVIMFSKTKRKIDDAYTWIRAIIIAWMCFMCISVIINLISEMSYNDAKGGVIHPLFDY